MQTKTQALSLKHIQQMQIEDAKTLRLDAIKALGFDGVSGVSLTHDTPHRQGEHSGAILISSDYYVDYARALKA